MKNSEQTELDSLYWSKKAFFTRARYAYASLTLDNKSIIEAKNYARAEVTRLIHAKES